MKRATSTGYRSFLILIKDNRKPFIINPPEPAYRSLAVKASGDDAQAGRAGCLASAFLENSVILIPVLTITQTLFLMVIFP